MAMPLFGNSTLRMFGAPSWLFDGRGAAIARLDNAVEAANREAAANNRRRGRLI
jgi:hypothetical protein